MRQHPDNAHHLATISHDGRFWDAYLEIEDTQGSMGPVRGRIAFSAAGDEGEPLSTATIFMEDTAEDVVARAREFRTHQLVALLRSVASGPDDESPAG